MNASLRHFTVALITSSSLLLAGCDSGSGGKGSAGGTAPKKPDAHAAPVIEMPAPVPTTKATATPTGLSATTPETSTPATTEKAKVGSPGTELEFAL